MQSLLHTPHILKLPLYARLLTLWFSPLPLPASAPTPVQLSRWFGTDTTPAARSAFDTSCRSLAYEPLSAMNPTNYPLPPFTSVEADSARYADIAAPLLASLGQSSKNESASAALGLVLLLDQMPRNIFRSKEEQGVIYTHYDRIARAVAHAIYAKGLDDEKSYRESPPWRIWFYLPLMHSEYMADHDLFNAKVDEMRKGAEERGDEDAMGYLGTVRDFEGSHRGILENFGRYPHRNGGIGRLTTTEEEEWLSGGGDRFGT